MSRIRIALASLLTLALVATVAGSALAATGTFTAAKRKRAVVKPAVVTVKASEFKFVLSQKSIAKPGKVTFKVSNVGQEPHNFVFLSGINKGTHLILPKKSATITLTFAKKGHYTYECTVGEHAEEGMLGTFTVK